MTLEQLAALPEGTKIRLWLDQYTEYGVVLGAGAIVRIEWGGDYEATSLIDTKSMTWAKFVEDIDEDPNQ